MNRPRTLALDVGGANLKLASDAGLARTRPFALWRRPRELAPALEDLLADLDPAEELRVTMTGELVDAYPDQATGVRAILEAVEAAWRGGPQRGARLAIWTLAEKLVTIEGARREPAQIAAANWLALARYAALTDRRPGLLLDVGSTTSDLIPLAGGTVLTEARSDPERLAEGSLVYSGATRTPVCALSSRLPWRGRELRVAAELFATTQDVWLTLNELPENPAGLETADGRPATREHARARLARMVCADPATASEEDARGLAGRVAEAQIAQLELAFDAQVARLPGGRPQWLLGSGSGEFLALRIARRCPELSPRSLAATEGSSASSAGPAWALARLDLPPPA